MKKATISLIILLMSLSGAFGQAFKIIGGISRARFTEAPGWGTFPEESFVSGYKPGSVFGIGVEFPLDRYLSFDVCILYNAGRVDDGLELLLLTVESYPMEANLYDSIGKFYLKTGNKVKAIESYKKALQLDPNLESSKRMLEKLTRVQ